jgi:uncharacterized SAM-binding protein YcdF (DUF218 family)
MHRSVKLFEKQGLEVIPAPVDYIVTQNAWENLKSGDLASQIFNLLPR